MTKQELSQLYWLNREIAEDKRRLAELSAERGPVTGLPFLEDAVSARDTLETAKELLEVKIQAAFAEYNRLNRYIASVEDSLLRQILALRYVNGLSWTAVAMHIGGGNTADSVRKAHNRFLKRS